MSDTKRRRVGVAATTIVLDLDEGSICQVCNLENSRDFFWCNCSHHFCRKCILCHFQNILDAKAQQVQCLRCPVEGCSQEVSYPELKDLMGKDVITGYVQQVVSEIDNAFKEKDFLKCKVCESCGSGVVPIDQIPDLSHREVQTALQARDLKRTRSKKDGVASLMNYISERSLLWTCTGCNVEPLSPLTDFGHACRLYALVTNLDQAWKQGTPTKCSSSSSRPYATVWASGTGYGGDKVDTAVVKAARQSTTSSFKSVTKAITPITEALQGCSSLGISQYAILSTGILNRVVEQVLSSSLLDIHMSNGEGCYMEVFRLLSTMTNFPELRDLVLPGQSTVVAKLEDLLTQAKIVKCPDDDFLEELRRCHDKLCRKRQKAVALEDDLVEIPVEAMYKERLKQFQFRMVDSAKFVHYFREKQAENVSSSGAHHHKRMLRIQKEIAALSMSLPLEWQSSIHVCVNENDMNFIKVLIIGPCMTPYQNGVFLFDVYLPGGYPTSPPKVQFLTTGGGKVCFNPNLYADGKVCLSLLGTWHDGPSWIPDVSTLLQVFVSIQSLIFVRDPYYNEPGYERSGSADVAEAFNNRYREHTLQVAILSALREPDAAFRDVIMEHFRIKRHEIEVQCDEWLANVAESGGSMLLNIASSMATTVQTIKSELQKLEKKS